MPIGRLIDRIGHLEHGPLKIRPHPLNQFIPVHFRKPIHGMLLPANPSRKHYLTITTEKLADPYDPFQAWYNPGVIGIIENNRAGIAGLCRKYGIKKLEVFGSAAAGTFQRGQSDVDFFYEFDNSNTASLADRFFGFQSDLEELLGTQVDLVSSPDATNPYFLQVANRHRLTLYAA